MTKHAARAGRVARWYAVGFLNMWGDDDARGTATFAARVPRMVDDLVRDRPEVIGVCEVREQQEPLVTGTMRDHGYELVAHSHRLGIYREQSTTVAANTGFYRYPAQNAGAVEGVLRARLRVNGSWMHIGVTHLDYRPGFEAGRVRQVTQGAAGMASFGRRWRPDDWLRRSVLVGDFNSRRRVVAALAPLGFTDAGAGARIDLITVGGGRPVLGAGRRPTASDHPAIHATLGRVVVDPPADPAPSA